MLIYQYKNVIECKYTIYIVQHDWDMLFKEQKADKQTLIGNFSHIESRLKYSMS